MESTIQLYFPSRREWRRWLEENHTSVERVWLVFHKKHTGKTGLTYEEAVREALCFGWIDSIVKKRDEETYMQKFTPRSDHARWSETNIRRVQELVREGLMTEAGLKKFRPGSGNAEEKPEPAPA